MKSLYACDGKYFFNLNNELTYGLRFMLINKSFAYIFYFFPLFILLWNMRLEQQLFKLAHFVNEITLYIRLSVFLLPK